MHLKESHEISAIGFKFIEKHLDKESGDLRNGRDKAHIMDDGAGNKAPEYGLEVSFALTLLRVA